TEAFADSGAPDYPDYENGDWEPVLENMGDEAADIEAADLAAASLGAAGLAPLAGAGAEPAPRAPRLTRMTAQEWPDLAASLPLTGLADELAHQSEWVGVEGDTITLRVAIWSLAARQGQARLRTVLTEHFGKVVQLKILFGTTGGDTARAVEQVRQAERQKQAEEAVENDPLVLCLIEEFGARVVPGSIAAIDDEKAA
ncbi:MAG: DNA polymerase III subunit gamma/tau, partial [Alcaligenaceae bacterium]|nr:DNA polymerase III subunit gamma/tau [Alcaligenaceae bacterium]